MRLEEIDDIIKDRNNAFVKFELDLSPYEVKMYYANAQGEAIRLREDILKAGFRLDQNEERIWSDWIKSRTTISE